MDSDPTTIMQSGLIIQIVLLIFLVMCSAFFSASETALMSISKIRVRHLVDAEVKGGKKLDLLLSDTDKLLSTILLGNNAVNIGASSLATSLAIGFWGDTGVGIATGLMTLIILIFGEITPKSLAVRFSEPISLKVAPFMLLLVKVLTPVVFVLSKITGLFVRILGGDPNYKKPSLTQDELKTIVNVSSEEGVIEDDEKELICNIFEFGELKVKDIMVQRMDIVAVPVTATYAEIVDIFKESKFSRLPVYEENLDNIVGLVFAKDLLFLDCNNDDFEITKIMRETYNTYEFLKVSDFFKEIQSKQNHIAIVYDEYGSVAGLITLEDVIESVMGDIQDEYDDDEDNSIVKVSENEYMVMGYTKIEEFNEYFGCMIESEDCDSIGGFLTSLLGRLPEKNEKLNLDTVEIVVADMEDTHVEKLKVVLSESKEIGDKILVMNEN